MGWGRENFQFPCKTLDVLQTIFLARRQPNVTSLLEGGRKRVNMTLGHVTQSLYRIYLSLRKLIHYPYGLVDPTQTATQFCRKQ